MRVDVTGILVPVMAAIDVTVAVVVAVMLDPAAMMAVALTGAAVGRRFAVRVADAVAVDARAAVVVPTGVPLTSARVVGPTPGKLAALNSALALRS